MLNSATIRSLRCYPGARAVLDEPTAICELQLSAEGTDWPSMQQRLCERAAAAWPREVLYGIGTADWPRAFLHEGRGTGLAGWVAALTVALQQLARDAVLRGAVLSESDTGTVLALPYHRVPALRGALQWALRYLMAWTKPEPEACDEAVDRLRPEFERWLAAVQREGLAPNTLRFALAARRRGIPVHTVGGMIELGWGRSARRMESSFTDRTSVLGTRIARSKHLANQVLRAGGVPVPRLVVAHSLEAARRAAAQLGWPVVVKPVDRDQGEGVVPGIRDEALLARAFEAAQRLSPQGVLVEQHVEGDDHRMLVVGGVLRMATRRVPGAVAGDGRRTVRELLAAVNADPRRGTDKRSLLIRLELDDEALSLLGEQGLDPEAVPEPGRFVRLRRTANLSTGGTPVDVTAVVHPDNRVLAERAARLVGLDIAGVDFLCPDITRSWREVGGAVCEVNGQPGFRPHWLGDPTRDVNDEIVQWMAGGTDLRIPTAAITGTNGKSTTARMLHRILRAAGLNASVATTAGVWIGDDLVSEENLSGYPGARLMFADPATEAAVIEMPRKGLLKFGHPCDRYDVAALLNVQDDHIGVDGIGTLDQMARLKAEVLRRAAHAIVVNADDPRCLAAARRVRVGRKILVGSAAQGLEVQAHLDAGGEAVFPETHEGEAWLVLARGASPTSAASPHVASSPVEAASHRSGTPPAGGAARVPLVRLSAVPATQGGLLAFNVTNAMFAAALAHAMGADVAAIAAGLGAFDSGFESNPGRYNFVEGFPFQVLLDFAHNPDGVRELCRVVRALPVSGTRRLVTVKVGNRHRRHAVECAPMMAQAFDEVIVSCDPDYVAKCADYAGPDPVGAMLDTLRSALIQAGMAEGVLRLERDPGQAIDAGLATSASGDLLVILAEPWFAMPRIRSATAISAPVGSHDADRPRT